MPVTPSSMILALKSPAPYFNLLDVVSQRNVTAGNLKSEKGLVVMFICNHCPFVQHIIDELVNMAKEYQKKGLGFVAINSNDVAQFPEDGPEKMRELAKTKGFTFPYLLDETQEVAKAYHASCTPDFYVFDKDNRCVYRGQLDEARPGNQIPVTGKDLREALDCLLAGKSINPNQKPSIGCNIKWKK